MPHTFCAKPFDYEYPQIADILQLEEANIRQLESRARKHIAGGFDARIYSSMMHTYSVALEISGTDLDLADVSAKLKLKPTQSRSCARILGNNRNARTSVK